MSELKAYLCIQAREIENKTFSCYSQTLAVKNAPEASMAEVYLKSEADKYIKELKNEIEVQKQLRNMALASVPNALKVMKIIQHHKYKRCLTQAQRCMDAHIETEADAAFFTRWEHRWLTLAEKFKEAK